LRLALSVIKIATVANVAQALLFEHFLRFSDIPAYDRRRKESLRDSDLVEYRFDIRGNINIRENAEALSATPVHGSNFDTANAVIVHWVRFIDAPSTKILARGLTPSLLPLSSIPLARTSVPVLILFKYLNSSNAATRAGPSGAQLRAARNRVLYTPRITLPDVHTTDEYQLPMPATFLRDVMRAFNAFKRLCALSDVFAGTTWRLVAAKHRLA